MYGFAQEALCIFPAYSVYAEATATRRAEMRIAVEQMNKYLRSKGITPKALVTDDLAREFYSIGWEWLSTLSMGDLYFFSRNGDMAAGIMDWNMDMRNDIYKITEEKFPYTPNMSIEDRFATMVERDKKAAKMIIPDFKIVVNFYYRGAVVHKVTTRPDDGRIRIIVDLKTLHVTPYLGGMQEEAIDLLGADYASRAITNWGL